MANYINNNILCQSYIHVEPEEISQENIEKLKVHLKIFTKQRADFFLYPETEVDIKDKEGSLILYITICGTVSMLYKFVKDYPTFREGVIAMYDDAKMLAENINTESLFATKSKHKQVKRIEARTGIIGSIRTIISFFDTVIARADSTKVTNLTKELILAEKSITRLLPIINDKEDLKIIKLGLIEVVLNLPINPKNPGQKAANKNELIEYTSKINDLLKLLK